MGNEIVFTFNLHHRYSFPHSLFVLNNKQDATQITAAPTIIAIGLIINKYIWPLLQHVREARNKYDTKYNNRRPHIKMIFFTCN